MLRNIEAIEPKASPVTIKNAVCLWLRIIAEKALDTATSVQIMDLIREIAGERLVIMVTHNPDLANEDSTRIIRLLDGRVTDDTNPYDGKEEKEEMFLAEFMVQMMMLMKDFPVSEAFQPLCKMFLRCVRWALTLDSIAA